MSTFRYPAFLRSRALRISVVALAAVLSLALSDTVEAQEVGRLVGSVVDQNDQPVTGATVTLTNEDMGFEATLTTDENGRFVRGGLRPGEVYQLHAEAPRHMPVDRQVQVAMGNNEITVTLRGGADYAKVLFNQGAQAYNAQNFQAAVDHMSEAVEILEAESGPESGGAYTYGEAEAEPGPGEVYVEALTILGSANLRLQNLDAAMQAYQKATEVAPEDFRGFWGVGLSGLMKGDFETAGDALRKAVEIQPTHAFAHFALGRSLVETEGYDEAIEHLQSALELDPSIADAHQQMGNAYVRQEEFEKAIEQYELYLEKAPDAPNRAQVEEYIERLREAIEAREQEQGQQQGQAA